MKLSSPRAVAVLLSATSTLLTPALAGNGLNVTGIGAQSLAMSSADLAVPGSSAAIVANPANLSQIPGSRFDGSIEPFATYGFSHSDDLNSLQKSDQAFGALLNASYAGKLRPDLTFGIGLFVAGGSGTEYKDLANVFGPPDEYAVIFGVTKIATGLAWQLTPRLSLGAAVNLSFAQIRQKVFPNTSNAAAGFYGLRLDSASGYSLNGRVGLLYQLSDTVKLGASYSSVNKLKLKGGRVAVNYSDLGEGVVDYGNARVKGFALPEDLGIGIAWQATSAWLISTEVTWLNWDGAVNDVVLSASQPAGGNADVPQTITLRQPLEFRDQFVFALGTAYDASDKLRLMAGINLARNPIPNRNVTPTINLTQELEFNFGFRRRLNAQWDLSSAIQCQVKKSESARNPAQPFSNARDGYGVYGVAVELSRSW